MQTSDKQRLCSLSVETCPQSRQDQSWECRCGVSGCVSDGGYLGSSLVSLINSGRLFISRAGSAQAGSPDLQCWEHQDF